MVEKVSSDCRLNSGLFTPHLPFAIWNAPTQVIAVSGVTCLRRAMCDFPFLGDLRLDVRETSSSLVVLVVETSF